MTDTTALAKDQIEDLARYFDQLPGLSDKTHEKLKALCDLALRGLAVTLRPLSEIDGPALVSWGHDGETHYAIAIKYQNGAWRTRGLGRPFEPEWKAIPLSSLPKVTP